jgi:ribonuclease P protein component
VRIGYTVTKKLSKSAVVRNRIRRRLREAVRLSLHNETLILPQGQGVMIVLSARDTAQTMPLPEIVKNLRWSLHRLGIIAK